MLRYIFNTLQFQLSGGIFLNIELFNKCSKNILIRINNNEFFLLKPCEKKMIFWDGIDEFDVSVRKEETSFFEKKKFRKKYILAVETKYKFSNIGKKDISLTFVRELVRVTGDAYYDKLVLCEKTGNFSECSSICDVERIKSVYKKRYYLNNILVSPFEHLTFLCLCILILTLVFAVKINFAFSFIFLIVAYFFIWILDNLIRKFSNIFHKKVFNVEDDKSEFEKILSEQHIDNFYRTGIIKAYNDEISRDEI